MTTILVVDDDVRERESMVAALAGADYRVVQAESATGAVRLALRFLPRLVVMKLALPDFDGREAARAIRSVAGLTTVPIIAVGREADASPPHADDAFGAACVLANPVEQTALLDAVSRCLRIVV